MSLSCYRNRHDPQDNEDAAGRAHRRVRAVVHSGSRRREKNQAPREAFLARCVWGRDDGQETGDEEEGRHSERGRTREGRRTGACREKSPGETPPDDQAALTA